MKASPETFSTGQQRHMKNYNRFHRDDKNSNVNCSKSANCDSESDRDMKKTFKKQIKKVKNFKIFGKGKKNVSLEKFNRNFKEKAHLKNMVVSGMATHKLYKGFQSQLYNTNCSNSIKMNSRRSKECKSSIKKPFIQQRQRDQSPNSETYNETSSSESNNRTTHRYQERNRPVYLNKNMHHMAERDTSVDDSYESNDAFQRHKRMNNHEQDFSSESAIFPQKPKVTNAPRIQRVNTQNQTASNQQNESISIHENMCVNGEELDEENISEKLKVASAALLMGKYSKRREFPVDDATYNQGSKRVLQFLHQLWLEQTTCDITIICDGGNVLTHQV